MTCQTRETHGITRYFKGMRLRAAFNMTPLLPTTTWSFWAMLMRYQTQGRRVWKKEYNPFLPLEGLLLTAHAHTRRTLRVLTQHGRLRGCYSFEMDFYYYSFEYKNPKVTYHRSRSSRLLEASIFYSRGKTHWCRCGTRPKSLTVIRSCLMPPRHRILYAFLKISVHCCPSVADGTCLILGVLISSRIRSKVFPIKNTTMKK